MSKKDVNKHEEQQVTRMQMLVGAATMIALIALVVSWLASFFTGDVMEATDLVSSEAVEAVTETIVAEEDGVLVNAGQVEVGLVDWFESEWIGLLVQDMDGAEITPEGFEAYGVVAGEYMYLWLRYRSDERGDIELSLPNQAVGLRAFMSDAIQEGINPWIFEINRDQWDAIESDVSIDKMVLTISLESGQKYQAMITMPYAYAGYDDDE
jgi:hypothetical protein